MSRKSRKNVGLIGLGIIGSRVAAGLRAAGFHVFVWNRHPRPAPNFLGSPIEVAELCEVIQIFVADGAAVLQTIEAFGEGLTERHVIINCATIGPEATLEAARMVQARGAAFLDAPFTGSKGAAEKSQLVYYVGGEPVVFERVKAVLEATSRAIVHCGKVGDAATLKVATNMITAVTTQTLAEALAIVRKCGIAPEAFGAAIQQNACKSGTLEMKLPKMLTGDFSPHFSLKHMFKDLQIAVQMANAMQLEIPVTTSAAGVMFSGINKGWGDLDFSSLFKAYGEPEAPKVKALTEAPSKSDLALELEEMEVIEAQFIEEQRRTSELGSVPAPVEIVKVEPPATPVVANEIPAPGSVKAMPAAPAPSPSVVKLGAVETFASASKDTVVVDAPAPARPAPAPIEAEIVGETATPVAGAPTGALDQKDASEGEADSASKDEEGPGGFRPFQRLRRFFAPSSK